VSPAPAPVRVGPRAGRLVVGACGLAAAGALLWAAGAALPGPGAFDGAGLAEWIEDEPVVAAFGALRLIGLALVAWVALSSAGAVVVHATKLGRRTTLRRTADRLCLPAVRRLVHGAVGAGFSVAVLTHGAPVGAVVGPAPVVSEADGGPTTSVPDERAVLVALVDPSTSGTPATSTPGTSTPGTSTTSSTTTTPATTRDVAGPTDLGAETAELWALADLDDAHRRPTAPPTGEDDTTTTAAAPAAATTGPPATRAATPSAAPPTSSASDPRSSGAPGAPPGARVLERALLVALDPAPTPPPPPDVASGPHHEATWIVGRGEHLWHVSETTLERHLGTPPSDAAVAAYLEQLVDANRDRLAVPDDPDLVFTGQELLLPPV
jgi:hypothetical protein